MQLYEHNQAAYNAAVSLMKTTGKAAIIHPTGTGKSFIAFQLAEENPDATICWLSPSEYIFKTQLENLKAEVGVQPQNIIFYTYAKLMRKDKTELQEINPDYIILDEFHRCGAQQWRKGVANLLSAFPNIPLLGLSATNIRYLDNQRDMADELFDGNIASEITLGDAIAQGILSPPTYVISVYAYQKELEKYQHRIKRMKNQQRREQGQKYLDELHRSLEQAEGLDAVFHKYIKNRNSKWIVFCANVEHMQEMIRRVPEWFSPIDPSPHIYAAYSEQPTSNESFEAFKKDTSGHLKLLFCINMLNEGVHIDHISGVILFRPTVSPTVYKQQIGRALAAGRTEKPVIFDVINNFENLYSIGTIQDEVAYAAAYYHLIGEHTRVIHEGFTIYDEARDCRRIFENLENSLSATWDTNFAAAKQYYQENHHLNVPKRYKTAEGLSLGAWLLTQRRVYAGNVPGILTRQQIQRLESIGMIWEDRLGLQWERAYQEAKNYYKNHGDLDVPANCLTSNGVALGTWVIYQRQRQAAGRLEPLRVEKLDKLGMIWNKFSLLWEKNYQAAARYYQEHGNLRIPHSYKTEDGICLGIWVANLRQIRQGRTKSAKLTKTQIERLDAIGMVWDSPHASQWEMQFAAAQQYFKEHGNLHIPITYKTAGGASLGKWIYNQRSLYAQAGGPDKRRAARLEAIGMVWDVENPWEKRYQLAKAYYKQHGDLNIPQSLVIDGIWLGKWVYLQRKQHNCLTAEQVSALNAIGMCWLSPAEQAWEKNFTAATVYFRENGNLNIPYNFQNKEGIRLGRWLHSQRKYRTNPTYRILTPERMERLNQMGMCW